MGHAKQTGRELTDGQGAARVCRYLLEETGKATNPGAIRYGSIVP
jgi:hypothetical protein